MFNRIDAINSSYKKERGHNFYELAEIDGTEARYYGSVLESFAQCGPLVFINMNDQRYNTDCTITFTYKRCIEDGYTTENVRGIMVKKKKYVEDPVEYTDSITIPKGTYKFHEFLFAKDYVHEIVSFSLSDETQHVKVFCLADDGARLLASTVSPNILDKIEVAHYISPPKCILCDGTGVYNDDVCPDCLGYGLAGFNAEGVFLEDKMKRFNIQRNGEDDRAVQWRTWARYWWLVPTVDEVKRYVAFFTGLEPDEIDIIEHYWPEAYFEIHIPIFSFGEYNLNGIIPYDDYIELFNDIAPAGTSVVIKPLKEYGDIDVLNVYDGLIDGSDIVLDSRFSNRFGVEFFEVEDYLIVNTFVEITSYQRVS